MNIAESSEPKKRNLVPVALGLAVAALGLSAAVLSLNLVASTTPGPAPVTREVRLVITSVEPHNETMAAMMEEMHLYMPGTLVVNRGDTIVLTIVNLDEHRHGFEIHGLNVETDSAADVAPGDEVTLTFVASQAGVFEWECNVPYSAGVGMMEQECGEDHEEMKGYLIVQ